MCYKIKYNIPPVDRSALNSLVASLLVDDGSTCYRKVGEKYRANTGNRRLYSRKGMIRHALQDNRTTILVYDGRDVVETINL